MLHAGVGYSVEVNPRTGGGEATSAALKQAGHRIADGALCFASSAHAAMYQLLVRTVADTAGTREGAGCGSIGGIAAGRGIETGPSGAVLVFGGGAIDATRLVAPPLPRRPRAGAAELTAAPPPT